MPLVRVHKQAAPSNISSGDWTITVSGTYDCGSTVQPFDLSSATMGSGRWVLVKANSIQGWARATVIPPSGRTFVGVSRENVNYSGTNYDCVVVTLG